MNVIRTSAMASSREIETVECITFSRTIQVSIVCRTPCTMLFLQWSADPANFIVMFCVLRCLLWRCLCTYIAELCTLSDEETDVTIRNAVRVATVCKQANLIAS